jgi:hypothetical protein
MRTLKYSNFLRPLLASAFLFTAYPAQSRITVIDQGIVTVDGYCTPGTVATTDCAPQALPFAIAIGGTTYDSFVLNGNGTVTLGNAAIDWDNVPSTLADFLMPVFAPQIDNTIFFRVNMLDPDGPYDADTRWAASFQTTADSLTAYWFRCSTAFFCGTKSAPAELYSGGLTLQEVRDRQTWGMFGLTLTDIGDGFRLDYLYYPDFTEPPPSFEPQPVDLMGTYGFNLPDTASLQTTGPLVNRTWIFDSLGQLAVPEPATWLTMLFGFAAMGLALRRQRKQAPEAA